MPLHKSSRYGPSASVRLLARLTIVASLFASAGAHAQEYRLREVKGWTVAASQDGTGCLLTKTYDRPGDTTLLLGLDTDRSNRLTVLNANWSIKPKDKHRLIFRLSNAAFPNHLAVGIASDGKQGFVTSFGERFPAAFAASAFLHIFRGDVPVERLDLSGSSAAVAELRRCVDLYRRKPATNARHRERVSDVPIDPFARDQGRRTDK